MLGHPAGNAVALVTSICWLLSDKTYCCVITRNGPIPQVLEDMGVAVESRASTISRLKTMRSMLERVRMIPRAVESLLV